MSKVVQLHTAPALPSDVDDSEQWSALEQEESKELKAQTYLALAMVEHQLRHPEAAQSALRNGAEIVELDLATLESGDIGGYWVDWIFAHALQREACLLIDGKSPPDPFKRNQ